MSSNPRETYRFGQFELDVDAVELTRQGRRLKLQPQPFKLLVLLARRAGTLVGREEIRAALWPDGTFVDFDQSVNFAVRQIRDVLGDSADRPLYVETIARRGYRFIAPVDTRETAAPVAAEPRVPHGPTTVRLEKALWSNIADLRMAEERRKRITIGAIAAGALLLAALITYVVMFVR